MAGLAGSYGSGQLELDGDQKQPTSISCASPGNSKSAPKVHNVEKFDSEWRRQEPVSRIRGAPSRL
jgi:hypothetical protein